MSCLHRLHRIRRRAPLAGALAAIVLTAPRGHADVTYVYESPTQYEYRALGMPDFDQRRSNDQEPAIPGLPGDGGMYCVPTSMINIMGYLAGHGFVELSPIPGLVPITGWQSQAVYDSVNAAIKSMGVFMDTTAADGTFSLGWGEGTQAWLERDPRVVFDQFAAREGWAPTEASLHETGRRGGLASFAMGTYTVTSEDPIRVTSRTGGHIVTLRRIARNGSSLFLSSRDPADSSDSQFEQSIFSTHVYTGARAATVQFVSAGYTRSVIQVAPISGNKIKLIDEVVTISPRSVISWNPSDDLIGLHIPAPLDPGGPVFEEFDPFTSAIAPLHDVAVAPDWGGVYFTTRSTLLGGSGRLAYLDFATGERTNHFSIDRDGAHVIIGRGRELYLVDDTTIRNYSLDTGVPVLSFQVTVPAPIADVAYDDLNDRLVVLSLVSRTVYTYQPRLTAGPTLRALPAAVPAGSVGTVRVEPATGQRWVHVQGIQILYGLIDAPVGNPFETASGHGVSSIKSFDFDSHRRLFVHSGGILHEFARSDDGAGPYELAPDSPSGLDGWATGGSFVMRRGRTNRTDEHSGPGWENIHADDLEPIGVVIEDCVADIDGDGDVGVADLLAVLAAWGECPLGCAADIDGSGDVDISDLLRLLSTWGPCPE